MINWHTVATLTIMMIAVGGAIIAILRGFFMTPKRCEEMQHLCQAGVCKKIDELKDDIRRQEDHYAEIKGILGQIKGKLEIH
jgi:hypothetical protein